MKVLITGGAGFIGCNLAQRLVGLGHEIVVLDNLARRGSERNLQPLADSDGRRPVVFHLMDVRDHAGLAALLSDAHRPFDAVVHLAGQTTVTQSIIDPVEDFDVNARGTLAVLEAVRACAPSAQVVFASTNKVYGDLRTLRAERTGNRYVLPDYPHGIPETFPTDAASPYGCSKLTADCYVRDYAKTYGIATTVFRTSCVYGKWQNAMVGQGWVSWFVRSALLGSEVTIYGDGLQVRDLLHVDDLIDAYVAVLTGPRGTGEVYNIGGGAAFSLAIWAEFGVLLQELVGHAVPVRYERRRTADQDVYISDHRKLSAALGWHPHRPPREGVAELIDWTSSRLRPETVIG
jgi:CDP-paratose 2-epimerase